MHRKAELGDRREHEVARRAAAELAEDPLLPTIPTALKAIRIGTCLNSMTRTLLPDTQSFDVRKLESESLIPPTSGEASLEIQANASSTAFAEESFFGTASEVKKGLWGAKVTAGFNMSTASKSADDSFSLNCYVSYIFKGQQIRMTRNRSPETYFQCMTADFQAVYDRIMNADTVEEYIQAYTRFTRLYGDSCVTALYLASGSAARISIEARTTQEARNTKYGASLAINSPTAEGGAAVEWGKSVAAANREAKMSVEAQTIPEGSPTHDWVLGIAQQYNDKGIAILTEEASAPAPPTGITVKRPAIPALPKGDEEPKKPALDDTKAVEKQLIEQMMCEDGFKGTLEEYLDEQRCLIDSFSVKKVIDETSPLLSEEVYEEGTMNLPVPTRPATAEHQRRATEDLTDLGGYIPVGYEVTPWTELFPDLRLDLPPTMDRIRLGKLWTYFLTRVEFSEYLHFLADVGPEITGNPSVELDATRFADCCERFANEDLQSLHQDIKFTEEHFLGLVRRFEKSVRELQPFHHSLKVYEFFFKHYALVGGSPLGYVRTTSAHDKAYYHVGLNTLREIPRELDRTLLIQDALRLYPIIVPDPSTQRTRVHLAYFHETSWHSPENLKAESWEKNENEPWADYDFLSPAGALTQALAIDYSHVLRDSPVRGAPMFSELPIDLIKGGIEAF